MSISGEVAFGSAVARPALELTGVVRNARLQILRGAAALSVAFYHASILLEQSGRAVFHGVFDSRFGLYGVAVFFAISGSLMANLASSGRPWIFLAHRIIRIYPAYLLVVGLAFVLSRTVGTPFSFDFLGLTLIPAGARVYPLGVEWTLVFEIAFYVLIFVVMLARLQRFIPVLALAWIAAILFAEGWVPPHANGIMLVPYWLLLSPVNLAFAGGLLVPFLLRRGFAPVLGLTVFGAVLAYEIAADLGTERWMGALLATGIVTWGVADRGHARSRAAQALQRLGDWSYALYLCHVPLILAVYKLWPVQTLGAGAWMVALGSSLVGAALVGTLDLRFYHRLKARVATSAPKHVRWAGTVFLLIFATIAGITSILAIGDEIEAARAERTLATLGAGALANPEMAAARIAETGLGLPSSFIGTLDQVDWLPTGQLALRGWAIDLAEPGQRLRFVVSCEGQRATSTWVSRRWRRDIAQTLGRPELTKARIGFTLLLPPAPECRDGSRLFVIAVDPAGRAAVVPGIVTVRHRT